MFITADSFTLPRVFCYSSMVQAIINRRAVTFGRRSLLAHIAAYCSLICTSWGPYAVILHIPRRSRGPHGPKHVPRGQNTTQRGNLGAKKGCNISSAPIQMLSTLTLYRDRSFEDIENQIAENDSAPQEVSISAIKFFLN